MLNIPPRKETALSGSEFIESIKELPFEPHPDLLRERNYLEQFLTGNIPDFLRAPVQIPIFSKEHKATIRVLPDYLAIGSNEDFVYIPMNGITFGLICAAWGGSPPTKKIVSFTHKYAKRIDFRPMTPTQGFPYDHSMMHTDRYVIYNGWCKKAREKAGVKLGELVSGHKKDVILDPYLEEVQWKKVGVFGGYIGTRPIHNFEGHSHLWSYKDYSHGCRVVDQEVVFEDGSIDTVKNILEDKNRFRLLNGHPDAYPTPFKGEARYPLEWF